MRTINITNINTRCFLNIFINDFAIRDNTLSAILL